jgi:hypothetical protein
VSPVGHGSVAGAGSAVFGNGTNGFSGQHHSAHAHARISADEGAKLPQLHHQLPPPPQASAHFPLLRGMSEASVWNSSGLDPERLLHDEGHNGLARMAGGPLSGGGDDGEV